MIAQVTPGTVLTGHLDHVGRPVGARLSRLSRCGKCRRKFLAGQTVRVELAPNPDAAVWVHAPICPPQPRPRMWRRWWLGG